MTIMSVVMEYFKRRANLRVKNTTDDTVELIYEIPRKIYLKASSGVDSIEDQLYQIEHIRYVNLVTQDDDITG